MVPVYGCAAGKPLIWSKITGKLRANASICNEYRLKIAIQLCRGGEMWQNSDAMLKY